MANILLINPCLRPGARAKYPPVGLAYIMHALKKAGFEFDFLDLDLHEMDDAGIEASLRNKKYDICGLGCIVTGYAEVKRITRLVRESSPECVIVAGNSVATTVPKILLTTTEVDIASMGEGDITIVELFDALKRKQPWKHIAGLSYMEDGALITTAKRPVIPNLDDIGFPDWNMLDVARYNHVSMKEPNEKTENPVHMPLNGARGCPYNCSFCYHVFKGQQYRKYSENAIMNEFVRLVENYNATLITLWDELSFPNISSVKRMVEALEKLPFRIPWGASSRGNLFAEKDIALIEQLRDVGCASVSYSIENADKEILKAMNKHIDHKKTIIHSHALHKGGVTPYTSIIFGYPQETPKTIKATLDLCGECGIFPSAGFLLPLPGTQMYNLALQMGVITNEEQFLLHAGDRQDFYVNMTKIPDDEFVDCVNTYMGELAKSMGLEFENPMKTGVYQKGKILPTEK